MFETPFFLSISLGDRAVFWGATAAEGREPWVTDGTARGTFLLADLSPGKESTTPYGGMRLGSRKALFTVSTQDTGTELLVTDGTRAGTRLVADLNPGPKEGARGTPALWRAKVYFCGNDGPSGFEPWWWFPGATVQKTGWSSGPASLDGDDPVLGSSCALAVSKAPKGTAGILLLGKPLSKPLLFGGDAALFLDAGAKPFLAVPINLGNRIILPVPKDPVLTGAAFAAQALVGPTGAKPFGVDFTNALLLTPGF